MNRPLHSRHRGEKRSPSLPANRIEAAHADNTVLVRVVGLGSVNNAGLMSDFVRSAFEDGWTRIAVDLQYCRGMDSTFMGTLVGLSQEAKERAAENGSLCVFNVSDSNLELLEIIGVDRYLRVKREVKMEPLETQPIVGKRMTMRERVSLVKDAHENLVKVDQRNEARFGDFLKSLAAELSEE